MLNVARSRNFKWGLLLIFGGIACWKLGATQKWEGLTLSGVMFYSVHERNKNSLEISSDGNFFSIDLFKVQEKEFEEIFKKQMLFIKIQFQDYQSPYAGAVSHSSVCKSEEMPIAKDSSISFYANNYFVPIGCRGEIPKYTSEMVKMKCKGQFFIIKKYLKIDSPLSNFSKLKIECE